MARSLNLDSVVRWIHWAPPGDLDGLHQIVTAKLKELGLSAGKRDNILPKNIPGDPQVNVRGIIEFVNDCEPIHDKATKDFAADTDAEKATKAECHKKLCQLGATLDARVAAAGYKPPEAEKPAAPPPLPAPTPDPKPLA